MSDDKHIADREHRALASGKGDGLDHSYLVEAGAGTGKTTVLVDRLMALLEAGTRISRIVAITFTEKAAGELKLRLRATLEKTVRELMEAGEVGREGDLLNRALHEIDRAQVSTIHGFCANILKERPVEAGVDPAFAVADELRRTLILDSVWDAWVREQFSRELPPAVAEAQSLGHGLPRIQELALHMVEDRDLLDLVPQAVEAPDGDALLSHLRDTARDFAELAATACEDPEDKALPEIRTFVRQVEVMDHLPDDIRLSYALRYIRPAPGTGKGRKGNCWTP
jgi:ATP-dependent helicase/nuclease subunit A